MSVRKPSIHEPGFWFITVHAKENACKRLLFWRSAVAKGRLHNLTGKQGTYEMKNLLELEANSWNICKGRCMQTSLLPTTAERRRRLQDGSGETYHTKIDVAYPEK